MTDKPRRASGLGTSTTGAASFAALAREKYLNLETFRRNGTPVQTPVWFALGSRDSCPVAYLFTTGNAGKVKRLRHTARVRIAPCDVRGRVTGTWMDATGEIVEGTEAHQALQLIGRRYWPWKQLLDLAVLFKHGHTRAVIAIRLG